MLKMKEFKEAKELTDRAVQVAARGFSHLLSCNAVRPESALAFARAVESLGTADKAFEEIDRLLQAQDQSTG